MTTTARYGGLLAAILTLAASPATQEKPPETPKPAAQPTWPALAAKQEQQIKRLCDTLKRIKNDERRDKAEAELVAMGSGVAPVLLERLSDYRVNINEALARVLDQVTDESHAPLLARHVTDHAVAARTYVVRRLMGFHLPAMAPVFREARKDRDKGVVFLAGLGLISAGDLSTLDEVFERADREWDDVASDVQAALPGARGEKATALILKRVVGGEELTQVTGLRLVRYVGEPSSAARIAVYLDSESHNVKKAAINALRVVVDGAPPLDQLSVFQAIDMAKTWKTRV